ncbi:MAG TPA: hypothetical protein VF039_12570 [Longimicrobiales bacterium]
MSPARPSRLAAPLRRAAPLLVLSMLLGLAACGDDEPDLLEPDNPIIGTWVSETGEYIRITRREIHFFVDFGSCVTRVDGRIRGQDDDVYTIDLGGGLVGELEIRAVGGELSIDNGEDVFFYEATNFDVDQMDICEEVPDGEFEPELATCSSLPSLVIGEEVAGALTAGDPIAGGYRYDMYRLVVGSAGAVRIDLTSNEIDAYLYLYAASGARLMEDDDSGDVPPDARITAALEAGCYVVIASSFGFAEVGDYVIGVTSM